MKMKGLQPDGAPGRDAWMHQHVASPGVVAAQHGMVIPDRPATDMMPDARVMRADVLLPEMQPGEEAAYVGMFLDVFDAAIGKPAVFVDAAGDPVVIGDDLFRTADGGWKIGKRGRSRRLLLLANALHDPDEIWTWMEYHASTGQTQVVRAYLARYVINDEQFSSLVLLRKRADGGWQGVTAHDVNQTDELASKLARNRRGVLLYRR